MSEKAPAPVKEEKAPLSRRERFEAARAKLSAEQAAEDRQAFESELYGEAGTTDFSDEAGQRISEATEYEAHLQRMASPDYVSTTWGGAREDGAHWDGRTNIDNVPNKAYDSAVAEGYESAETGMDAPREDPEMDDASERHLPERQLAKKLLNPELTGTAKLKDGANKLAMKTVNTIEAVAHSGRDVRAFVKGHRLKASHRRADDKLAYLEYKAEKAEKAFVFGDRRRRKIAAKMKKQTKVVNQRKQKHEAHVTSVEQRHESRKNAVKGREEAYESRYLGLVDRKQLAMLDKSERRLKKLGRYERFPVNDKTRHSLEQRKSILNKAIAELMAS